MSGNERAVETSFTLRERTKSGGPPTTATEIMFTYGVRRTKAGELQCFWGKGEYSGNNALAQHTRWLKHSDEAKKKAEELLSAWRGRPKGGNTNSAALALQPGVFCVHSDGEGHHNCLIIGRSEKPEPVFHVLMLTRNPRWNRFCRPASEVEIAQLVPSSRVHSWLAPVSRPISEFFLATRMTDPKTLRDYWQEFEPAFSRYSLTLTPELKRALNDWAKWQSKRQKRDTVERVLFEAMGSSIEPFRI